jgi:3-oxoacyl-[acyl-carrier-protein] synthase III
VLGGVTSLPYPPKHIRTKCGKFDIALKKGVLLATETSTSPTSELVQRLEAAIAGWGFSLGSSAVDSADVDREFGLTEGTLCRKTGIHSLARAQSGDSEVTLAREACQAAAGGSLADVDLLLATSETNVGHPALAAALHEQLDLSSTCAAMDIGGACAGLLHAFSVAKAMLSSGVRKAVLVVASEVHSRWFTPEKVTWKLGALFGDGACAFLLRAVDDAPATAFRLGDFVFGCDTSMADTIRVNLKDKDSEELAVDFRGTALADTVLSLLAEVARDFEERIHTARADFAAYAIHQPNPRLVEIFARQTGVPMEKIPAVARTAGNLGSATCGVSLCHILSALSLEEHPGPVLMASVGPGLQWAATCLQSPS